MKANDETRVLRISSDDLPERDRLDYVREVYGRVIIKQDIEPPRDRPFYWRGTLHALPGLGLAATACSRLSARRGPAQTDGDHLILSMGLAGERVFRQRQREAVLTDGMAVLSSGGDVGECEIVSDSQCVHLRVARAALAPMVADLDAALVRPIPATTGPLSLLRRYLDLVQTSDALTDPQTRKLVVAHVEDLLALALGATRDSAMLAGGRGVRAARLCAVKAEIMANLGARGLSLPVVAARLRISPSYVRKLFESEGTSFTDFVLTERLARARRLLTDAGTVDRTVADIALEAGFGDLSYFNRAFRRRFGDTPSGIRAQAASVQDLA